MKPFLIGLAAVSLLLARICGAADSKAPQVEVRTQTNGLCLGLIVESDGEILFSVYPSSDNSESPTTTLNLFLPSTMEYLWQAVLFDEKGNKVRTTKLGETLGRRFNDVERVVVRLPGRKPTFKDLHGRKFQADGFSPPGTTGFVLCQLSDLFKTGPPGKYVLKARFQVYQAFRNGTNSTIRLIRFPEVEYPIVQP